MRGEYYARDDDYKLQFSHATCDNSPYCLPPVVTSIPGLNDRLCPLRDVTSRRGPIEELARTSIGFTSIVQFLAARHKQYTARPPLSNVIIVAFGYRLHTDVDVVQR